MLLCERRDRALGANRAFVDINKINRIHLMGIGGAGMSGLAQLLKDMGKNVSGCDAVRSCYAEKIAQQGIPVAYGHHQDHLELYDPELLIFTSAIPEAHAEIEAARKKGVVVAKRAEVLSQIFNSRKGVGVAGTHGKTTTSSMISMIAEEAGCGATVVIGGELCDIGCNAKLGLGDYIIAELDESDGSFELFTPDVAVVTNVDWDHIDHYASFQDVRDAFSRFANHRKHNASLILCAEDAGISELIRDGAVADFTTYGWGNGWNWGAADLHYVPGGGMSYTLFSYGERLGEVHLAVSGEHNVLNSLAACAAAHEMGISLEYAKKALRRFKGAKRRLQHVGGANGIDVYDDYGHHPREIAATLQALNGIFPDRKKTVIFQPHRFTRTEALFQDFARELARAEMVFLLPIYGSDEPPLPGVTSSLIFNAIKGEFSGKCKVCDSFDTVIENVVKYAEAGDIILTMGAGSIGDLGKQILRSIQN